VKTRPRYDL